MKTTMLSDNLLRNGFGKISYPHEVQRAVAQALQAWRNFYAQSNEHKMRIPFENNGGYELKNKIGDHELSDFKEDFHITRYYEFPESFKKSETDHDAVFVSCGRQLLDTMRPLLKQTAEIISDITNFDFVKLAVGQEDGWVARFLHYPPQEAKIIAENHPDKGGHTFHLYDSVPGFQRYWEGKWQSMSFKDNEMVFFPGLLGQYYSKCVLKALTHRVVSSPESRTHGRDSIVLFNDYATSSMVYDKGTHGRTQQLFAPGQHYDMPFSQFSKYFTNRKKLDAR